MWNYLPSARNPQERSVLLHRSYFVVFLIESRPVEAVPGTLITVPFSEDCACVGVRCQPELAQLFVAAVCTAVRVVVTLAFSQADRVNIPARPDVRVSVNRSLPFPRSLSPGARRDRRLLLVLVSWCLLGILSRARSGARSGMRFEGAPWSDRCSSYVLRKEPGEFIRMSSINVLLLRSVSSLCLHRSFRLCVSGSACKLHGEICPHDTLPVVTVL